MSDESNQIEQFVNNSLADKKSMPKMSPLALMQGYSEHALDEKCRLILPARFTKCFESRQMVITRGYNKTLWILHPSTWEKLQYKLANIPMTSRSSTLINEFFSGSAEPVPIDSAGRFMVPQHLRVLADIQPSAKDEKAVVLQGVPNRIEIWSKARWQDYNMRLTDEEVMAAMEDTGFSF
jgi:MraZ protein